jgi:large subunit ribosomal protein L10e
MGLRKGSAYSKRPVVPYTRRSKKKAKSYIKTIPPSTVVKYFMGNEKGYYEGKFPIVLTLVSTENIQIRDSALEACRQYINKNLETNYLGQYYMRLIPHPHHIQRENKMLTGAGSDRMQTGMQLSFGKSIDRAAIVKKGGRIFSVAVATKKAEQMTRKWLTIVKPKLPCTTKIISEEYKVKPLVNPSA